jgi:hypothetical protein
LIFKRKAVTLLFHFKKSVMKLSRYAGSLTAAIVCAGLLFSSCKKKQEEDNDTEGVKDHALAETCSNDITNIGAQASYGAMTTYKFGAGQQVYSSCAIITFDSLTNTDPDTLFVDFGTSGCVGQDGRTRKGMLRYVYTTGMHYRDSGNVINVATPNNTYFVDGNQVIINSKTISNMGHVTSGMLTWNISADIRINKSGGGTVSWTSSKTKVLLAGEKPNNLPIDWANAQVGIFGTANGTTAKGESFKVQVLQANMLQRNFACGVIGGINTRKFFVAGRMDFTPGTKLTRYINFGTGACDNEAVVTIGGNSYNVILR